jgi:hypothetical protein
VTEEEATEALQVAMTVGATRMQVMLNAEQTKLGAPLESPASSAPANAQPQPVPPGTASFTAAEVVPQAGGG